MRFWLLEVKAPTLQTLKCERQKWSFPPGISHALFIHRENEGKLLHCLFKGTVAFRIKNPRKKEAKKNICLRFFGEGWGYRWAGCKLYFITTVLVWVTTLTIGCYIWRKVLILDGNSEMGACKEQCQIFNLVKTSDYNENSKKNHKRPIFLHACATILYKRHALAPRKKVGYGSSYPIIGNGSGSFMHAQHVLSYHPI